MRGPLATSALLALLALLALPLVAAVTACSSGASPRCETVCRREEACARQLRIDHDQAECIDSCKTLDRDPALQPAVDRHVTCVERAEGCRQVMACE